MSLHGYHVSKKIVANDPPFYALIMAAMWKADTDNLERLRTAWPNVWVELQGRYNAPMGVLPEDGNVNLEVLRGQVDAL